MRVLFQYRQAVTGSKILKIDRSASAGRKGAVEFEVTGAPYLEGGRVLSWHLTLFRGGKAVATRQSYLWE